MVGSQKYTKSGHQHGGDCVLHEMSLVIDFWLNGLGSA
jgi:hypothetical protein